MELSRHRAVSRRLTSPRPMMGLALFRTLVSLRLAVECLTWPRREAVLLTAEPIQKVCLIRPEMEL
jgi:hypothetical protein